MVVTFSLKKKEYSVHFLVFVFDSSYFSFAAEVMLRMAPTVAHQRPLDFTDNEGFFLRIDKDRTARENYRQWRENVHGNYVYIISD